MEDNNNNEGQDQPSPTNVVNLKTFRENKNNPIPPQGTSGINPEGVTVGSTEPKNRKIIVNTPVGDILTEGFVGLSDSFLAVGDQFGRIKFAAAPGHWHFVTDVSDLSDDEIDALLDDE